MMLCICPREKEVKELVELGQWPVAVATAQELRAHVDGCRSCREFVLVTTAFQKARAETASAAKLGSPGVLWWRAQLRRRNAAVDRIGRPILGAQIFALAVYAVLAIAFVVWQARSGFGWLTRLEGLPQATAVHLDSLWTSAVSGPIWTPLVMISAVATLALLGGVVVYLSSEKQ
jgi:hypothetical protein